MRRWVTVVLAGATIGAAAVALLPWWLGAALRPVARAAGVRFERYERIGYARFRLTGVRADRPGVRITADRIEADTPVRWLARLAAGGAPPAEATGWRVRIGATEVPRRAPAGAAIDGMPALQAALERIGRALARWVPAARLRDGAVELRGHTLELPTVLWRGGRLDAPGLRLDGRAADASVVPGGAWTVSLRSADPAEDWQIDASWRGSAVEAVARVAAQPVRGRARFAAHGWLPAEAEITADRWDLPAARVRLGDRYARLRGGGRLEWRDGAYTIAAQAEAIPVPGQKAPPLSARLEARGDGAGLTISALHVDAPFAAAELSAPVTIGFGGARTAAPARLSVRGDLAGQPWLDARGRIAGSVQVAASAAGSQEDFQLVLTDGRVGGVAVREAAIRGALRWPRLEIEAVEVDAGEQGRVLLRGACDLHTRVLDGVTLQGHAGAGLFARWLPAGAGWSEAEFSAQASGPLEAPAHSGTLRLTGGRIGALAGVSGDARWRGHGAALDDVAIEARAGGAGLRFAGGGDTRGARLRELIVTSATGAAWRLAGPAAVTWSPVVGIHGVRFEGPAGGRVSVEADGGETGSFRLDAAGLEPAAWRAWLPLRGPDWRLERLHADGRLIGGRLAGRMQLAGRILLQPRPADVRLELETDGDGLRLTGLDLIDAGRVFAHATGRLPVVWQMRASPHLVIDPTAPVELDAAMESDSPLWAALAAEAGVVLTSPAARLHLGGTLERPRGELRIDVARLAAVPGRLPGPIPGIDDLAVHVRADGSRIEVDQLSARIEGQALRAQGRLTLAGGGREWWRGPAGFDWRAATAEVEIPDADLASLARRLPELPAVAGRFRAAVRLAPGGQLSGELHLSGGMTRPIAPLGVVEDIAADLALAGRTIEIQSCTGRLGGEPVTLAGRLTVPAGGPPRVALTLHGRNVPLIRQAGLLVRADLDLRAEPAADQTTRVAGTVALRDCLVLADLNDLLPVGGRSVDSRPPYFAVTTPPFNRWPLAIDVSGARQVRIRTTVFRGTASPRFRLGGTLGEPRAVGELDLDEGQVLFPFASFRVQVGVVRLPESDPYHPQLAVTAVANRPDYQLRMEATGAPEAPVVVFSSTPPLEPAQVLLLVTTGQAPVTPAAVATPGATATGQQRLTRLGAYLGTGFLGGVGGADENHLTLTSGDQPSREGRTTYEVEYRLDDRWSLVGEYDEFDNYNAGLKWRVFGGKGGARGKP